MTKESLEAERSDETGKSKRDSKESSSKKQKNKLKPTHVIICVLSAALVCVLAYFLWPRAEPAPVPDLPPPPTQRPTIGGRGTLLTPENVDEVRDILEQPVQDAQYTVSMTRNWVFDTALTPSRNASVDNLERNTRMVYFDVILKDTGQMVYSSPYIPLGLTHDNFALDEDLPAGVYEATITFFLVDDDYEYITDVSASVTLTING